MLALVLALELAPLSVRVNPRVGTAPLDIVRIEAVVPRHADNRAVCITLDGPGPFSRSCQPLDGESSPVIIKRQVLGLNKAGTYEIRVELFRDGKTPFAVTRTNLELAGNDPTSDVE